MSPAVQRAVEIRNRLRNPPNAVRDTGIDLRRKVVPIVEIQTSQPASINQRPVIKYKPLKPYMVRRRYPSLDDISDVICERFEIDFVELASARRSKAIVYPRQLWCHAVRKLTETSFPAMGRYLGGRDHTTALHAYNKIESLTASDPHVLWDVTCLKKEILARFEARNRPDCFDWAEV